MKLKKDTLALILSVLPMATYALPEQHMVVAPQCLVDKAGLSSKVIAKNENLRLLSVNPVGIEKLIAAKQARSKTPCGGFMDVTDDWKEFQGTKAAKPNKDNFLASFVHPVQQQLAPLAKETYEIKYRDEVNKLLPQVTGENMWKNLTTLSNKFENREARRPEGKKAAEWLSKQITDIAAQYHRNDVTVFEVTTNNYVQPSIVAKIGSSTEPGIVIGAHMDTLTLWGGNRQPGADDDGSGTVTTMEAARTVLASGLKFKRPIYFIWYAAEEEGLIGSKEVVRYFRKNNIPVAAAVQFDMTGFAYQNDPTLWLLNDYVNQDLTTYLVKLVEEYVKKPVKKTQCGYACSDHASWHNGGIPASAPFEAKYGQENQHIHSTEDLMDLLSLDHMTDFSKLAVAFAVEMAEPVKS